MLTLWHSHYTCSSLITAICHLYSAIHILSQRLTSLCDTQKTSCSCMPFLEPGTYLHALEILVLLVQSLCTVSMSKISYYVYLFKLIYYFLYRRVLQLLPFDFLLFQYYFHRTFSHRCNFNASLTFCMFRYIEIIYL